MKWNDDNLDLEIFYILQKEDSNAKRVVMNSIHITINVHH